MTWIDRQHSDLGNSDQELNSNYQTRNSLTTTSRITPEVVRPFRPYVVLGKRDASPGKGWLTDGLKQSAYPLPDTV